MDDFRPLTLAATRAALHVLRNVPRGPELLKKLVDGSHDEGRVMSDRVQTQYDPLMRRLPVCGEGCAWCCYAAVLTTVPEVIRIAQHLRETCTPEELAVVRARVAEVARSTRELTAAERYRTQTPCPLLDTKSGACTVHDVRPGICRGYNSCDVSACINAFETKDMNARVPGNPLFQKSQNAVWLGQIAACEIENLDAGCVELSAGLHFALENEDALDRWLAGERFDDVKTKMSRVSTASYDTSIRNVKAKVRELEGGAGASGPSSARDADEAEAARRERNKKKRAKKGR